MQTRIRVLYLEDAPTDAEVGPREYRAREDRKERALEAACSQNGSSSQSSSRLLILIHAHDVGTFAV